MFAVASKGVSISLVTNHETGEIETMQIPKIITHKNIQPLLDALTEEQEFKIGAPSVIYDPSKWYRKTVTLEVAAGELCKDGLTTLALVGRSSYTTKDLTGKEGFAAQGLEGKVIIRKELFGALMNMRDLVDVNRGRIITR